MSLHSDVALRSAEVADAAAVAVQLDAFNREFDSPTPGPAVLERRLVLLLARDDVHAVLAGVPAVGLALLTLRPNVWYDGPVALLDELYVVPEWRNAGIGAQLLDAAEQFARARGCGLLEINVDGADVDARRFYDRHGYVCVDPGPTEPALYYYKNSPSSTGSAASRRMLRMSSGCRRDPPR